MLLRFRPTNSSNSFAYVHLRFRPTNSSIAIIGVASHGEWQRKLIVANTRCAAAHIRLGAAEIFLRLWL
jgi:hypothetical protein